jgi:UDP-glucose 4-epimerase
VSLRDSRILVTGGAGFIGSHLVDTLMAEGCRVRILDNLTNGKESNVAHHQGNPNFELMLGSITDPFDVEKAMEGMDVVYNLACLGVRHSIKHPFENHRVNTEGTLFLLEQAHRQGVRKFIHCSSSEVYGTAKYAPMPEDHPTYPCTVYGASKLAGEAYARAYYKTYGLNTVVIRPFNTFGPRSHHEGDAGEIIPKSIVRALAGEPLLIFGDGTQTRDFTYVEDTAKGLVMAAKVDTLAGQTLNIGNNQEISMNQLAEKIVKLVGNPAAQIEHCEPRPGDVLRLYADGSEFIRLTGWNANTNLEAGLQKTIAWFRSCTDSPTVLLKEEVGANWK